MAHQRAEPMIQLIPGLQYITMDRSILTIVGQHLQPVSMMMSMLRVSAGIT